MIGRVTLIDNCILLVGSGETIGSIHLMPVPPGTNRRKSCPQEQRYYHANTENKQPMHSSFGWWLAMDNNSSVPLLDNLVAPSVNIAPRAGWHTSRYHLESCVTRERKQAGRDVSQGRPL